MISGKVKMQMQKKICAVYGEGAVTDQTCQKWFSGFPCWSSGKESTLQCKGPRFHPWSWKIPHTAEQISPCAATAERV